MLPLEGRAGEESGQGLHREQRQTRKDTDSVVKTMSFVPTPPARAFLSAAASPRTLNTPALKTRCCTRQSPGPSWNLQPESHGQCQAL